MFKQYAATKLISYCALAILGLLAQPAQANGSPPVVWFSPTQINELTFTPLPSGELRLLPIQPSDLNGLSVTPNAPNTPVTPNTLVAADQSLKAVLQYALRQDPTLLEAAAEREAAIQTRKGSEALHYPTLSLVSAQRLAEHDRVRHDRHKTDVGVQGRLNLYAWGGIEATILRDRQQERFAYYKYFETREELGAKIADLYASVLFFREALVIAQNNLTRHQQFLKDLHVVIAYDPGRGSELAQAESRYLAAESQIIELERALQTTLAQLNLYTSSPLTVDQLTDPFEDLNDQGLSTQDSSAQALIDRYPDPNTKAHPSLLAQIADRDSAEADIAVAEAATRPQINLDGMATRNDRHLEINFTWDLFNRPATHNTEATRARMHSATARTEQIRRDIEERYITSKIEMVQHEQQARISKRHIKVQSQVAASYAEQFKVSRRTLLEVLDSYAELSRTESAYVNARHHFRLAAIAFLLSQAKIAHWAGLAENL